MLCVKAPMLATYSLLPIIQRFAKPMGVEVMRKMARARICKPFKELRNRFPAWRACRTGPPGYKGQRNRFLGSINVYKYGLSLLTINVLFEIYVLKEEICSRNQGSLRGELKPA
jgi:hypothetical protein